jgi:O-antigen ligase
MFLLLVWATREFSKARPEIIFYAPFIPALLFGGLIVLQLLLRTSAYWYATWFQAMLWVAYGMMFFLVTQCFWQTALAKGFGIFFSIYGFFVALFAIAQEFTSNGKIYWVVPNKNLGWFYGPYVNHSHYAGLMEMLVPIPLVIAMANLFGRPIRLLFAFSALLMGGTIFLSQSLGGMLAFTVEIGLLVVFLAKRRSRGRLLLLGALCIALAAGVILLRPHGLGERLANLQHPIARGGAEMRVAVVKDSVKMVKQRPLLGWGLGVFPIVYPSFRSFYSNFYVNEAHNDFVQLLIETGIAGFILISTFLVLIYYAGVASIGEWRYEPSATMALAALIGCTGLLVHGLADFNLRIPANAALFVALAGLSTAAGASEHAQRILVGGVVVGENDDRN